MENYLNDDEIEKIRRVLGGKLDPDLWKRLELILRGAPSSAEKPGDRPEAEADTRDLLDANDRMACDSAAGIYTKALGRMGVPTQGVRDTNSLRLMFRGERSKRRATGQPLIAMDEAAHKSMAERFPDAARIGIDSAGGAW